VSSDDTIARRPGRAGHKRPRPTLKDVAKAASVSVQTVSNVVNGRYEQMTPDTRARVEQAMADLAYHLNSSARGLRSTRTSTLAFLMLDESAHFLADPMSTRILAGIGDIVREHGFGLLIESGVPGTSTQQLLAPLHQQRADGALLLLSGAPAERRAIVDEALALGVPCVLLEEEQEGSPVTSVMTANRQGARQLAAHLVNAGHRRIAFVGAQGRWPMVEQRLVGYREALVAGGIELDPALEVFEGAWDALKAPSTASKLLALPERPTAIMCGSDLLALGVLQGLRLRGMRVPEDVAVTGFNDFDFAAFVDPPLTTVRTPGYLIGQLGAQRLLSMIEGRQIDAEHLVLTPELVVRGST
jgi:DNA-binding LacI/PurR family transcriptional regulator